MYQIGKKGTGVNANEKTIGEPVCIRQKTEKKKKGVETVADHVAGHISPVGDLFALDGGHDHDGCQTDFGRGHEVAVRAI